MGGAAVAEDYSFVLYLSDVVSATGHSLVVVAIAILFHITNFSY